MKEPWKYPAVHYSTYFYLYIICAISLIVVDYYDTNFTVFVFPVIIFAVLGLVLMLLYIKQDENEDLINKYLTDNKLTLFLGIATAQYRTKATTKTLIGYMHPELGYNPSGDSNLLFEKVDAVVDADIYVFCDRKDKNIKTVFIHLPDHTNHHICRVYTHQKEAP